MSASNDEYQQRRTFNYMASPFDDSIIMEGEELDKWRMDNERMKNYYANHPDEIDDDEGDWFRQVEAEEKKCIIITGEEGIDKFKSVIEEEFIRMTKTGLYQPTGIKQVNNEK